MFTVLQVILLFLAFCIIHLAVEVAGLFIKGHIMRMQQNQKVDDIVLSIYKGILKFKLKMKEGGIDA